MQPSLAESRPVDVAMVDATYDIFAFDSGNMLETFDAQTNMSIDGCISQPCSAAYLLSP